MLHGTQGQVSFWSGWAQERNGWGKKRRLPSEEMRTVASFSTVLSSPSLSVTYRKSTKGVWLYKYINVAHENCWILLSSEYLSIYISFCCHLFLNYIPQKKLPPVTKINHFLLTATHWGFWWREQVCVTKASLQPFPIGERECDVQEGQACAVCRARFQALKLLVCFNS